MLYIIHRLHSALSDPKVRQDMNVEEEYFLAIENRDTAIMLRDQKIAERDALLAEQGAQLAEKDKALLDYAKTLMLSGMPLEEISTRTTLPTDILKANL